MPDAANHPQPTPDPETGASGLFPDVPPELTPSTLEPGHLTAQEARNAAQALDQLKDKMIAVSVELAQGKLNQSQFQAIYTRYCEQKLLIEQILARDPESPTWQDVAAGGQSGFLRRQFEARILGIVLVEIQSGLALRTLGQFDLSRELLVPIVASLVGGKAAAFERGARTTLIEGGRWLGLIPGEFSACIVLFSQEPSAAQLSTVASLQRDFERINQARLITGRADPALLEYPHQALFV